MPSQLRPDQMAFAGLVGHVLVESGLGTFRLIKDNRSALAPPTVNDDSTQGYSVGSMWVDTVGHTVYHCAHDAPGAAAWSGGFAYDPGEAATISAYGKIAPGEHALGTVLDYQKTGSFTASEIQYTRTWLVAGLIMDRMSTFVSAGANGTRDFRMGIYDQLDPLDPIGVPRNRVAQTNPTAPAATGWARPQLTNAPTGGSGTPLTWLPVTGFYWMAFITDETALQFCVSDPYQADYAPVYRETGTGLILPATVGVLTNPVSAISYVAAVEQ